MDKKESSKRSFSIAGLPVAKSYIRPAGRGRLLLVGGALGVLVLIALSADFLSGGRVALSSGPLSSSHASFENDCATCHTAFEPVSTDKCSACHEKYGDQLGVYSFDAHYVYRSRDATRAYRREGESLCVACHPEHVGREAAITSESDLDCAVCHEFSSFNDGHPQFDFAVDAKADDAGFTFAHIRHVKEVRTRQKLDDIEAACLFCHQAQEDGRSFEAISYERVCSTCHLGATIRSATLPVRAGQPIVQEEDGEVVVRPAVETLDVIRARQGPGEQWALSTNPNDFQALGRRVMRVRLEHEDPWILHNLGQIRRAKYPSPGLAELLKTSAEVPEHEIGALYEEAIATLRDQAAGLRGRDEPWVQYEIQEVERLLREVERRVGDPNAALDDSRFLPGPQRDRRLSADQLLELTEFAERLAAPCLRCHTMTDATLTRTQPDQQVLKRAEFNHRAHILQRRCLDCHTRIPFLDYLDDPTTVPPEVDNASIQNLPGIETCQTCHTPTLAANKCSTCHDFHPSKENRSRLQLYLR